MAKNYKDFDDSDGVWRTVGGRKIFIKHGQDLASAMVESGKFKNLRSTYKKNKEKDEKEKQDKEQKENYKEKVNVEEQSDFYKKLSSEEKEKYENYLAQGYTQSDIENTLMYKTMDQKMEETGVWEKQPDGTFLANKDAMKKQYEENHKNYDAKIKQFAEDRKNMTNGDWEGMLMAYEMQNADGTYKTLQDIMDDVDKYEKSIEANKPAGQKTADLIKESGIKTFGDEIKEKENKIETISKADYDKMPNDYKGTLKELVDTAEFRGENKQELIDKYTKMGYDVEKDKTVLKNTAKGTTLTPVKVEGSSEKYTVDYFKNKGVEIKDKAPEGWQKLEGATTAPNGYEWYSNGKSRFGGEYKNALVKKENVEKTNEVKVKGENNVIPRDFEKGYGRFKVSTNANERADDRFEITKDEYGDYHAKNLRTGETFTTFKSHLSNNNVFEFESTGNDKINNTLRQKAYQKYLKEHPNSKLTFNEFKDMRK